MRISLTTIRRLSIAVLVLAFVVVRFFYHIDPVNNCTIKILPSFIEFSNLNIKRALVVLRQAAPNEYKQTCANVETISPNPGCGGLGGGCYYEGEPGTIYISTTMQDLLGSAAIIVHETCHAIQAKEGRNFDEQECYEADDRVFRSLSVFE